MGFCMTEIRILNSDDLYLIEALAEKKIEDSGTPRNVFMGDEGLVFKHFVLPNTTIGGNRMRCFGYFTEGNLVAIIGIRNQDYQPSWILSFIVTGVDCDNSIKVIKSLMTHVIEHQEKLGMFQWFVVSRLEKFKAWQKLFNGARSNYNHYVYARVKANTMPKWLGILQLNGNKLFPYDTNISMYVSKKLCTNNSVEDSDISFDESDHTFL
jgi:hypothetical protein